MLCSCTCVVYRYHFGRLQRTKQWKHPSWRYNSLYVIQCCRRYYSEKFHSICRTIFIEHKACGMRVADGTNIFCRVHPSSYASPHFPHSETNFEFDFIHKTFYLFPPIQYTRGIRLVSIVSLGVTSYDMPRGRKESNLKHDAWSFHKRVDIKNGPLFRVQISGYIYNLFQVNNMKTCFTHLIRNT